MKWYKISNRKTGAVQGIYNEEQAAGFPDFKFDREEVAAPQQGTTQALPKAPPPVEAKPKTN